MAKIIRLFTSLPDRQITRREYLLHIEQSQYHMPQYLELSRHMSFSNI